MEKISLKKFEKNKLSKNQLSKIIGSGVVKTGGDFAGTPYTDEFRDSNGNGRWDTGEYGCATINKQEICGNKA